MHQLKSMFPGHRHRFAVPVFSSVFLVIAFVLTSSGSAQRKPEVDLALVLAVDCSFSVDAGEFDLQMQGLARAFASREVIDAIKRGPVGRIAVEVVQWSSWHSRRVAVPWQIIGNEAQALALAQTISASRRLTADGGTSISSAIDFSVYQLVSAPVSAQRYVIDISADGINNSGERVDLARDRALSVGITINGLTILNEVSYLDLYFRNHIVGGAGHFVMVANDYLAYAKAIKRKLIKEIRGIPVS